MLGDLHQSPTPVNDLSIGNVERCLNFKDLQGIFLESKDVYGYLRDNPIHICNLWQRSKKTWRKTKWNNWNNQRFPVICSLNQPIEQIRGKDRKNPKICLEFVQAHNFQDPKILGGKPTKNTPIWFLNVSYTWFSPKESCFFIENHDFSIKKPGFPMKNHDVPLEKP